MRTTLPLAILVALAALPAALAHGAPSPVDYQSRVLADDNDDCGGDGAVSATGNCRGSHDLIALDIQERDLGSGLDLSFRFWFNKGATYPITDTLTFKAGGVAKTLAIKTINDQSFAVEAGFASVGAPHDIGDEGRFWVEATVKASALGIGVGTELKEFRVESKAGSNLGDFMPGGCKTSLGTDCAGTDTSTRFSGVYTTRGASYYASLTAPSQTIQVAEGSDSAIVNVEVVGQLAFSKQTITVSLQGLDGASGGFHHGAHGDNDPYEPTATVTLTGRQSTNLHLRLHGDQAGASGTLTLLLTTDLGGRTTATIPYTVTEPSAQTSSDGGHVGHTSSSKGSPAAAAPLVGLALLGLALRRRS